MLRKIFLFILIILIGGGFFSLYILYLRGINVIIKNTGANSLTGINIIVTGNEYSIDTLAPLDSKTIRISPKGETGVAIRFESQIGPCVIPSRGYYEASFMYHGNVEIELESVSCEPRSWVDNVKFSVF